jgi:hypothetical protein
MNNTATFVFGGKRYEVDVDGVNCHQEMMVRLPSGKFVRLNFPRNSLAPTATQIDKNQVGNEPIRDARAYVRVLEFPAFGHRYAVTVPEDEERLDECLGMLPDGTYVVLFSPLEITDPPFEQTVLSREPLFIAAQRANRIFAARKIS